MASGTNSITVLQDFFSYPFDSDGVYKQGLDGITNSSIFQAQTQQEQEETLLKSRIFYFQKVTGHAVDIEAAKDHQTSFLRPESSGEKPFQDADVERPLTFAQLKELIEQGKTDQIPNNRVIPTELHAGTPSTSQAPLRPKPWEVKAQTELATTE